MFVYGTGNATTLPERFYIIKGVLTQEYSKVNQYRLDPYHRLDLSATYTPVQKRKEKCKAVGCLVFTMFTVATIHILFISIRRAVLLTVH